PRCASPAESAHSYCRSCGIWLAGQHATELRWIAAELRRVDEARTWLISRRAELLDDLARLPRRLPSEPPARQEREYVGPSAAAAEPGPVTRRPEVSARTAARLLLAAGATLVVIAVTIFTIADWSRIGPLGRCGILLAATALVLAAPRPLLGRRLSA